MLKVNSRALAWRSQHGTSVLWTDVSIPDTVFPLSGCRFPSDCDFPAGMETFLVGTPACYSTLGSDAKKAFFHCCSWCTLCLIDRYQLKGFPGE